MKQLLVITTLITSLTTYASEDTWGRGSVTLPTLGNVISGFVTDSGNFRIDTLGKASAEVSISGGYLTKYKKTAAAFCSAVGSTLDATKVKTNNTYTLSGFVYPLSEIETSQSELKIENKPNLVSVSVKLTQSENSFLDSTVAREFEKSLAKVMTVNISETSKTGEFQVNLAQVDDVMCDLILGQSKLEFNYTVTYELAKHLRTVVISPNDFSVVYESLRKVSNKATSVSNRNLIFGVQLSQILKLELDKSVDDLGQDNFLKIADSMIDIEKGSLKSISPSQYESVAKATDILKIYWAPANQNVLAIPKIQEK